MFAEEKVAEQAQPQAQVQQQTASQTTQQAVSDKLKYQYRQCIRNSKSADWYWGEKGGSHCDSIAEEAREFH